MANLQERLLLYANGNANMNYNTMDEHGVRSRTITERKRKLARLDPDYEIERDILDARQNKKAASDAGMDMLLDAIKKKTKPKKGKA